MWCLGPLTVAVVMGATVSSPPALAPSPYGDLLRALDIAGYPAHERAPTFSTVTTDDRRVELIALRGRVVLLTFWATWCRPCLPELQTFDALQRELEHAGLAVVAVNAREGVAAIARYARSRPLAFPLVRDERNTIGRSYGVVGLPTTFVIARDGRAVGRAVGPRDWTSDAARALFRALLAEPSR